jgi:hypothetical protein
MKTTTNNEGWTKELNPISYPFFTFFKRTVITREDNLPYLIRITLISIGKLFSIKLHKIILSDDACIHDHPWSFISFIFKGGYYEWTVAEDVKQLWKERGYHSFGIGYDTEKFKLSPDGTPLRKTWYGPGSLIYRPAKWAHALELKRDDNGNEIPASTFVITLRVTRKWGFFTPFGWIYWRNYQKGEHCNG